MNKKIKYFDYWGFWGLFLVFFIQVFDYMARDLWGSFAVSIAKNIVMGIWGVLFFAEVMLLYSKGYKPIFFKELLEILKLILVLIILLAFFAIKNEIIYINTFISHLLRWIIPVLLAFTILNVMTKKQIELIMEISLVVSFIGYFIADVIPNFSVEAVQMISFAASRSVFESNMFSPVAAAYCLYFGYHRKKCFLWLSVLFVFLTFKRFIILTAAFLLLFGKIFTTEKQMPVYFIRLIKIAFAILAYIYIALMMGKHSELFERILGISVDSFTMGRSYLLRLIMDSSFKSAGFGSMAGYVQSAGMRHIEMDLPQFYIEMGILSVLAVIHFMLNLVQRSWYNLVITIFCLVQMLTSHWYDITYFWILMYITIGSITYKSQDIFWGTEDINNIQRDNIKIISQTGRKGLR